MVLVAFFVMVIDKYREGLLPEVLWSCHPAALLVGFGLLLGWARGVEVGGLFLAGPGLVGYVIELAVARTTAWPSFVVHALGPLVFVMYVRRAGLRPSAKYLAGGYYYVMMACSRLLTPPALNINMAFGPYRAVAPYYGAWPWLHHVVNLAILAVVLLAVETAARRWGKAATAA